MLIQIITCLLFELSSLYNIYNFMKSLLVLALLVLRTTQNIITLVATPTITTINQGSNYTFLFYRDLDPVLNDLQTSTTIPVGSIITITFPSSFSSLTTGSYNCTTGLTCTMSGYTLTVSGYYNASTSDPYPTFTVFNITNPGKSGSSGEFAYSIKTSAGTVVDSSAGAGSNLQLFSAVTLTPGSFQSCSLSTAGTVYSKAPLTLAATPSNPIPSGGALVLTIPQTWSNSYQTDRLIATLVCANLTNTKSTLACSYDIPTSTITVSNLNSDPITASFSFTISNVTLPPTVDAPDSIGMYSKLSSGETIDTCSASITGVVAATLQNVTLTASVMTVARGFNGTLRFTNPVLMSNLDYVVITVPASIGPPGDIAVTGYANPVRTIVGAVINITYFSDTIILANNRITVTLINATNPPNIKQTDNLLIQIFRSNRLVQSGTVTYQSTAGSLTANLTSTSYSTNGNTSSQLLVTTSSPLPVGTYLSMVYSYAPKDLTAGAKVSQCTVGGTPVSNVSYNLANRVLVFSNIFNSSGSAAATISINFT